VRAPEEEKKAGPPVPRRFLVSVVAFRSLRRGTSKQKPALDCGDDVALYWV
jgi:hypothetical protein